MFKLRQIFAGALTMAALGAQAQNTAMELSDFPITQLEKGQEVDVHGPYTVVASKFGLDTDGNNTDGAIQLFYNNNLVKQYKHPEHWNDDLGKPETVAIDQHGIVIGAPLYVDTIANKTVGLVEVYKRVWNGSHYTDDPVQSLYEGTGEADTDFGRAVDINNDWIAIGAPQKGREGGVKMYRRSSSGYWYYGGWLQLPNFENAPYRKNSPNSYSTNKAEFGSDVEIMNNKLIVGAPGVGSFYIYELNGHRWELKGEYQGPKRSKMGIDVTISDNHALGSSSGEIAVLQKHWDGSWIALQTIASNNHIDDIAVETRHLVVGKPNGDTDGDGIVEYYELRSHPKPGTNQWVYDFVKIGKMHIDVSASPYGLKNHKRLGYSVAIQGNVVAAGAHNAEYETVADGGAFRAPFHEMAQDVSNNYRTSSTSFDALGTTNVSASSITLYPNPAVDVINISAPGVVKSVSLTSMSGEKTSLEVEANKINISGFSAGIYHVSVTTEEAVITEKVVIQ